MLSRSKDDSRHTDEELIERYRNSHETHYVGILFNRYAHLVFGVCLKYLKDPDEAQDFAMQVFEQLIDKLKRHEVLSFRGWLHQVTKNHCLMHLRKVKSINLQAKDVQHMYETHMEMPELPHLDAGANGLEGKVVKLREGMEQLNEQQRICVQMFYLDKRSYKEVADETGFDLKKVKSYIQNGKRNLHIYMTKNA